MTRSRAGLFAWSTGAAVLLGLLWARPALHRNAPPVPAIALDPPQVWADGSDFSTLLVDAQQSTPPRVALTGNPHAALLEEPVFADGRWRVRIRAGVLPGRIDLRVEVPGLSPAAASLTATAQTSDRFDDGTPDFLRLDDPQDRQNFRRWFTWLAEAQYFQTAADRPSEINDCAALIRYAYRETLRVHESGWAESARVPLVPAFPSIAKYQYPFTPLSANLYRIQAGPFHPTDLHGRAFAQFADAQTLWRYNTHKVGRDPARALPGDLLFFRHDAGRMPFHGMIWLGESQLRRDGNRYIVYHTGPDGDRPGEIRRLTLSELLRYPQPEWRPLPGNPTFLGVFRWNILRKAY